MEEVKTCMAGHFNGDERWSFEKAGRLSGVGSKGRHRLRTSHAEVTAGRRREPVEYKMPNMVLFYYEQDGMFGLYTKFM
jgi:hypothetical protein